MRIYLFVALLIIVLNTGIAWGQSGRLKNQVDIEKKTEPSENKETSSPVYKAKEVDTKAVILVKPEATFTQAARKREVSGAVVLKAVLSSTGEIDDIKVVKGLSDGLTDSAIQSAKLIKFQPAVKDGRKVSQYATIEYVFILDGVTVFGDSRSNVYYKASARANCHNYSAIPYKDSVVFRNTKEAEAAGYTKAKTKCP